MKFVSEAPDKTEKVIRFGCGFVFCLAVCVSSLIVFLIDKDRTFLAIVFVTALVFGIASMRYGDSFWRWVGRHGFWWWG